MGLLKMLFGPPKPPARPYVDQGLALTKKLIGLLGLSDWSTGIPVYTDQETRVIDRELTSFQQGETQMVFHPEIISPMQRTFGGDALRRVAGRGLGFDSGSTVDECPDDWKARASTYLKAWAMNLDPDALLDLSRLLVLAGYKNEAKTAAEIVANWFPSYAPRFFAGREAPDVIEGITTRAKEILEEISKLSDRARTINQPNSNPAVAGTSTSNGAISTAPPPLESQSWTAAAESVAQLIGNAFAASHFKEFFGDQQFSDEWTRNDALAVWYFFGTVAMDIAIYATLESAEKANEFGGICDKFLSKQWPMPQTVLARFKAVRRRQKDAEDAFSAYHDCKSGSDFAVFFPRCVNRILGSELPFHGSTMDLILGGYTPKTFDPALGAEFANFFVDTVTAAEKLITDVLPGRDVPAEKQVAGPTKKQQSTSKAEYPTNERMETLFNAWKAGGKEALGQALREKNGKNQS